ncbi:MAG: Flp pilus assembly protein CpaB, partial [Thermodesulfobacteriota bacterium]
RAGGLAEVTPVGKRAITISVDNIAALAGMIKPGDYVDLIVLLPVPVLGPDGKQIIQVATIPLLQNVLVLAVGQEIGAPSRAEGRYEKGGKKETGEKETREISSLITVALAPQEANLLVFIQEQGKIRLIMRSPADSQISQMQMVTPNNLALFLQHVLPKEAARSEEKAEVQPTGYVEIYRGLKREKVPLSQ